MGGFYGQTLGRTRKFLAKGKKGSFQVTAPSRGKDHRGANRQELPDLQPDWRRHVPAGLDLHGVRLPVQARRQDLLLQGLRLGPVVFSLTRDNEMDGF